MKHLDWIALILALIFGGLILVCGSAQAQLSPYVQGGLGYIGNMGYENPDWTAAAGLRDRAAHWEAEGRFQFDSAHKYIGNGYSLQAQGDGYWCHTTHCLGAGSQWVEESTSLWTKTAWRPLVAYRERTANWTFSLHANPGSGTDCQNHEHAFGLTTEYALDRHWTAVQESALAVFKPTNQPAQAWMVGKEFSGALRYSF
jgi:hypothetical protein